MKKHIRWILTGIVTLVLVLSNLGMGSAVCAAEGSTVEVTRLEWLKALTKTFQMSVEEDNYPDNYYSDIDASDADYYDIMLATEFGLVDVEAGDALEPDAAATREFAAHTLNLCMGYVLEEGEIYTFSEAADVAYPDDIQLAVNQGWLTVIGGKVFPNQGITVAEKDAMIAAAEAVVASTEIDYDFVNQYEFVEGVVVVPEGTEAVLTGMNELTIFNSDVKIQSGDIFVVFSEGLPVAKRAVTVTVAENTMVIAVEDVEMSEAFVSLEAQGQVQADLRYVQPVDENVELAYIVGGTEAKEYEDGITYYSLDEVEDEEITAVVATRTVEKTNVTRAASDDNSFSKYCTVQCKITNPKFDYDFSVSQKSAYFNLSAKVSLSASIGTGDIDVFNLEEEFVKVPIGAIGYFAPAAEGTLKGSVTLSLSGELYEGIQWSAQNGVRFTSDFQKQSFTVQSKAEARLGAKVALGVSVGIAKAEIYAKAGMQAACTSTNYTDNQFPAECRHLNAHLYASAGGSVSIDIVLFKTSVDVNKEIFNAKNSPVKVALHYEDGKPVSKCTRDGSGEDGSGTPGGGTGTVKQYKYYTPIDSQYAYSGANTGIGSNGEPYTIFEYSLNESNEATITKYSGNVSALNIPETIDGYTVVGIGSNVFKNNTRLRMVRIPDTVTKIGIYAFSDCTNLSEVTLSKSLVELGDSAFYNCDALTSIEIPKSLDKVSGGITSSAGAFRDCDNLKTVIFEQGTTEIAEYLFANCTGLEEIMLPDTVTEIEFYAFKNCTNLKSVKIPSTVTIIRGSAFSGCRALTKLIVPDTVTEIGTYAFSDCTNLSDVMLSKALVELGDSAFYNCDALTSIEIPKSLDKVSGGITSSVGAFRDCDNLKTVIFEQGTTEIAEYLFANCTGLEEIMLPDTVTEIEFYAFKNCTNLKSVKIPSTVTIIRGSAFSGCRALTKLIVPDTVTEIGTYAFSDCTNLSDVMLSKALVELGDSAFYNCDALTSIEIPKSLDKVSGGITSSVGAFRDCDNLKTVIFEQGTTEIAEYLFANCTGLEEIMLPDTVTAIEHHAFKNCINLKTVKLPTALETISYYAFRNCSSLQEIDIPDTVTGMGTYTFSGCTSLAKVKLPNIRKTIPEGTFQNCTSLTEIALPDSVAAIDDYAFQNSGLTEVTLPANVEKIGMRAFEGSAALVKVDMGEKVNYISSHAFRNCDALQEIKLPDSVTTLGTYSFADCELLKTVELGTGLTKINSYTFNLCPSLEKIVLPYRMTEVASNAFTNCTKLREITIPRSVTTIGSNAFSYPTNMTVYGVSGTYAETWADSAGATFVNQEKPATQVSLSAETLELNKGKTATLTMTVTPSDFTDVVTWKSNNTAVATISDTGVVTAKGVGEALLRVTVGNVSASCKVTVLQPVTSISLNKTNHSMEGGDVYTLQATVYPGNANNKTLTWSSSDETVATVDAEGKVTALKKGTAVITAMANDGSNVSKNCTITVTNSVYHCNSVTELESAHNYENNCKDVWLYTLPGESKIAVTFDDRTEIEDGFDYLYIYDASGNEVGKYSGTELAGQTLILTGDTVKLKMDSDESGNAWGFKVTKVEAYCQHTFDTAWSSDETSHWHAATCGHAVVMDEAEHTSTDWIIDKEATKEEAGSRHKECTVCGRILASEVIDKLQDPAEELAERLNTAVSNAVDIFDSVSSGDAGEATPDEIQEKVAGALEQISATCSEQNIAELGLVPVDTAISEVERLTPIEEDISSWLGTSVNVVAKDETKEFELPTVQNALLSVAAGENATIKVDIVDVPPVENMETQTAMAFSFELFNEADEKMQLKVPVLITMKAPASVQLDKEIIIYHFHDGGEGYAEVIPIRLNDDGTVTFVAGSFSTFVFANAPAGFGVNGTVTSFGGDTTTNLRLTDAAGATVAETNVTGNSTAYSFEDIPVGSYTLVVSKQNHVAREYAVTVADADVTQDVEIHLLGDVTGDGDITVKDQKKIYNHIAKLSALTDYDFMVGDVTGDGDITVKDQKKVYNHIAKISLIW